MCNTRKHMVRIAPRILAYVILGTTVFSAPVHAHHPDKALRSLAAKDDPVAQYKLGRIYLSGHQHKQDYAQAMQWLSNSSQKGYAPSQFQLAEMYLLGKGTKKNAKRAANLFHSAAEQGDIASHFSLALLYGSGIGVKKDVDTANRWLASFAKKSLDYALTAKWLDMASTQDFSSAYRLLARIYEQGTLTEQSSQRALELYYLSAKRNDLESQYRVGLLLQGGGEIAVNRVESTSWLKRAADRGHPEAKTLLEKRAQTPGKPEAGTKGVEQGGTKSAPLLDSASQRDRDAQFQLGEIYYQGSGTADRDLKTAAKWYRSAAEQGHREAQFKLGNLYSKGWGVKKDKKTAKKWYRAAADQGHVKAKYKLHDCGFC